MEKLLWILLMTTTSGTAALFFAPDIAGWIALSVFIGAVGMCIINYLFPPLENDND